MTEHNPVPLPDGPNLAVWARHIIHVAKTQAGTLHLPLHTVLRWEPIVRQVESHWLPKLVDELIKEEKEKKEEAKAWRRNLSMPSNNYWSLGATFGWAIGNGISGFFNTKATRNTLKHNILALFKESQIVRAGPDLSDHERTVALAAAEMALEHEGETGYHRLFEIMCFVIVGGNRGSIQPSAQAGSYPKEAEKAKQLTEWLTGQFFAGTEEDHKQWLGRALSDVIATADGKVSASKVIQNIASKAINIDGTAWATAAHLDGGSLPFKHMEWGKDLFLGNLKDGDEEIPIGFAGNEALVTVAQPGAGKTQTHVVQNLISYEGSIVALDPKLELMELSAGFRQSKGYDVFVLNLAGDDVETHKFNIMDFIDDRPEHLWASLIEIAEFMIPATPGDHNPIFRNSAAELFAVCLGAEFLKAKESDRIASVTGAIRLIYHAPELLKNKLFDASKQAELYGCDPLAESAVSFSSLLNNKETVEDAMRYQSNAKSVLSRMRGGVIDNIANGPSDWHPEDLRKPGTTLYIRVPFEQMAVYAGFIRAVLYLIIKRLRQSPTEQGGLPVTLLLDEVAQLGKLDQITNVIETGRGFGLRPWLILQDFDQAKAATDKPALILKTPKVRLFMRPSLEVAREVSEELGELNHIITGKEKPLATIAQLVSEPFKDDVIVLSAGARPLRLVTSFAWRRKDYETLTRLPYEHQ